MKRRVFDVTGDFIMIQASAADIVEAAKRNPAADFTVTEKNPIIGNDDLTILTRSNGATTFNEFFVIPKTLRRLK